MTTLADKKLAILETTLRLITAQGFHATPMSQIAKEANVAAGTIYHYFASKEVLIVELYAMVKNRMGKALIANIDFEMSYKAIFKQFWLNQYQYFRSNPTDFWFLEQYAVSPFIKAEEVNNSSTSWEPVILFLQKGIADGLLKPMNAQLMAYLLNSQVATLVKLELLGLTTISQQDVDQSISASWDMVAD